MRYATFPAFAALPFILPALSGCALVGHTVPADVSKTSAAYEVRSEGALFRTIGAGGFEVGPYKVGFTDRNGVLGRGFTVGPYQQQTRSDTFAFAVAGPRTTWQANCERVALERGLTLGSTNAGFEKSRLRCALYSGTESATVELAGLDNSRTGTMHLGGTTYTLRQYFADEEMGKAYVPGPLGLRIDAGARNAAALELVRRPEMFWLDPSLPSSTQDALATALAALLMDARRR